MGKLAKIYKLLFKFVIEKYFLRVINTFLSFEWVCELKKISTRMNLDSRYSGDAINLNSCLNFKR